MSELQTPHPQSPHRYDQESQRLELVITCVDFDDVLDVTLPLNHPQFDNVVIVTTHEDRRTQLVARKHSVRCVTTDLFRKNGRSFNKGAAINVGMDRFQYYGWRLAQDVDIIDPPNLRRILFNHTHLDRRAIYGASRTDVIGKNELEVLLFKLRKSPDHAWKSGMAHGHFRETTPHFVDDLRGYCPIGFFQLWHASQQREYPYSLGTAAHDDVMFAAAWPREHRHLLPFTCYHLCETKPYYGQNWDGQRRQPRLTDTEGDRA